MAWARERKSRGTEGEETKGRNAQNEHRADVALATFDLSGEIPEEKSEDREAG